MLILRLDLKSNTKPKMIDQLTCGGFNVKIKKFHKNYFVY